MVRVVQPVGCVCVCVCVSVCQDDIEMIFDVDIMRRWFILTVCRHLPPGQKCVGVSVIG